MRTYIKVDNTGLFRVESPRRVMSASGKNDNPRSAGYVRGSNIRAPHIQDAPINRGKVMFGETPPTSSIVPATVVPAEEELNVELSKPKDESSNNIPLTVGLGGVIEEVLNHFIPKREENRCNAGNDDSGYSSFQPSYEGTRMGSPAIVKSNFHTTPIYGDEEEYNNCSLLQLPNRKRKGSPVAGIPKSARKLNFDEQNSGNIHRVVSSTYSKDKELSRLKDPLGLLKDKDGKDIVIDTDTQSEYKSALHDLWKRNYNEKYSAISTPEEAIDFIKSLNSTSIPSMQLSDACIKHDRYMFPVI